MSPATVALNRGNISDSLMILLLVLAADAVSAAIARGSQGRLVLAAVWVGLAFQAKMIEAWLVLPAFGLAYLVSAPGPAARRVRQLAVAGVVAGLVSLSWMTAVSLVPAAHRPYVDGSHDNSVYEQVFVYNGFGRFGDQTPLQLLAGQSLGIGSALPPRPRARTGCCGATWAGTPAGCSRPPSSSPRGGSRAAGAGRAAIRSGVLRPVGRLAA